MFPRISKIRLNDNTSRNQLNNNSEFCSRELSVRELKTNMMHRARVCRVSIEVLSTVINEVSFQDEL